MFNLILSDANEPQGLMRRKHQTNTQTTGSLRENIRFCYIHTANGQSDLSFSIWNVKFQNSS